MHFRSLVCHKMSSVCPGDSSKVSKRKKTRRGKRYRNEDERRKLVNEYMKQRKHRVAPSNTTQFIIEDREKVEPILHLSPGTSLCGLSSPEVEKNADLDFDFCPSEELQEDHFNEQFFLKDFETTYRRLYRENLYALTKNELLERVKGLEDQRDLLERERRYCCVGGRQDNGENTNKQVNLRNEYEYLQLQNSLLRSENKTLREEKYLDEKKTTSC